MNATSILANSNLPVSKTIGAISWCEIDRASFAPTITRLVSEFHLPLSLMFAADERAQGRGFVTHAVLSVDPSHEWIVLATSLPENDPRYPSVTQTVMAAHWYERYLHDLFGIEPVGHPDLRRLVHHENIPEGTHPLRKDFAWNSQLPRAEVSYPMHHVAGEGIYEIPVGPIHAGIIEPGHFRFNVAGERIITLEGKLFFTHKGVEKLVEGKSPFAALPFVERVSGDMAASHALAFSQAVECIAGVEVPERGLILRSLLCELERMTMHIHDIANMGGMGTGFSVMASQGFRIKERLMRLSARVCGNRFWRLMIAPGGMTCDVSEGVLKDMCEVVGGVAKEMHALIELGRHSDGLRERLDATGVLSHAAAAAYSAVGLPARASGVDRDVRRDHPYAAYQRTPARVATLKNGDVYARFKLRAEELQESARLIGQFLDQIKSGPVHAACEPTDGFGLGAVESWRGEIVTAVRLLNGKIDRCIIRDPSFCNWALFGELGPGNLVPDFPLCNKSLNLSYSGTDL